MKASDHISYFGYGSLVNLNTLRTRYVDAVPATLGGWRRVWLTRPFVPGSFAALRDLAFLSVEPSKNTRIDGMLVLDARASLPSLDERETLYDRHVISHCDVKPRSEPQWQGTVKDTYLYVAQPVAVNTQPRQPRILRSYLDAVFQGFHTHFGEEGVYRFVETTANFDLPIFEDRSSPLYPRAVELSQAERALFDALVPAGGWR